MRGGFSTVAAILLASASAARAAEQPICAARPGKTTAPCTVPAGHFQLETGLVDWSVQKTGAERDRDTALIIGETAFKYGLTGSSDIEVDVSPWQSLTSRVGSAHDRASGFGDVTVSYKQQLAAESAPVQLAVLPFIKIPTAGRSVGNGAWEGGLLLPIAYNIPKSPLSIALTPEMDWNADQDGHGHHVGMVQGATLGIQVNDRINVGLELWGQWDWEPAGTTRQASADAAIAYLASNNVQLDAGVNVGLNAQTPDQEIYAGVSVRF